MAGQGESAGHVFISYVRENKRAVDLLQRALEAEGVRVWRDTADLWPGEDWRQKIRTAIVDDTLVFIACFSSESNARAVTYQNEELAVAIEQLRLRRPDTPWLIPVRFDDCEIPDLPIGGGRTLTWLQRADLYGPSLRQNTDRLVAMVLRILSRPIRESAGTDPAPIPDPPPVIEELLSRNDSIITFYSYRGGTGRSLALANVAWILAANGRRVLIADWDLEAPSLHRFFLPFTGPEFGEGPGIIDMIRRYEWGIQEIVRRDPDSWPADEEISEAINSQIRQVGEYPIPVLWQFPGRGSLEYLPPGRQDRTYVASLDWEAFYNELRGGDFLDALRLYFKQGWDYVLIDSRAGQGDLADICTTHLPDILLNCFTLNPQSIHDAAMVARITEMRTSRDIRILPVPMRVDDRQKEKSDAGLAAAIRSFDPLPAGMSEEQRLEYWSTVGVPYRSAYAYDEILAAFDRPSQASLLPSFERITGYITNGAVTRSQPVDEASRARIRYLYTGSSVES